MATAILENVSKTYQSGESQVAALRNINLILYEGEFAALCGPSGSGKSSLLNLIGCLDKPTSGSVSILGNFVSPLNDDAISDLRGKFIGFTFSKPSI